MGNPASKIEGEIPEEECSEGSVPSTPILTPKKIIKTNELLDPRSPTSSIIRTPIEFLSLQSAHPHDHDTELGIDVVKNEDKVCTPPFTVLDTDPRSPTTDFLRTPIVVCAIEKAPFSKPRNRHLESVRDQEVTHRTPAPKLLESSPISTKANSGFTKRKSMLGLLETNIDFTETDLDVVIQEKSFKESISVENKDETVEEESKVININVNLQPETVLVSKSDAEVQTDDSNIIILPSDLCQKKVSEKALIKENADSVNDFNKKLTNLIYEDDSSECTSRSVVVKDGSRTPLAVCNTNQQPMPKKSSKLRVSDKPRKSTNASKIPVYKDKLESKLNQQCENTPPRSMLGRRLTDGSRQSRWDHDSTLII